MLLCVFLTKQLPIQDCANFSILFSISEVFFTLFYKHWPCNPISLLLFSMLSMMSAYLSVSSLSLFSLPFLTQVCNVFFLIHKSIHCKIRPQYPLAFFYMWTKAQYALNIFLSFFISSLYFRLLLVITFKSCYKHFLQKLLYRSHAWRRSHFLCFSNIRY